MKKNNRILWDDYTVYVYSLHNKGEPICWYTTNYLFKAIFQFIKWNFDYDTETIMLKHIRYY